MAGSAKGIERQWLVEQVRRKMLNWIPWNRVGEPIPSNAEIDRALDAALLAVDRFQYRGKDRVVLMYWFAGWSLKELSQMHGVTPPRVRQRMQNVAGQLCQPVMHEVRLERAELLEGVDQRLAIRALNGMRLRR